ncbi:hypothetical protein [Parvularcula lutaonensis]|uniref:Uncharacterized protein n=1 Tax=Parvularcula lutaonensis TaxID=491923 RepID=A0ABV7M6Z5_9PROT|nr:hypothetical protein [Parvularcula lutaonensis]
MKQNREFVPFSLAASWHPYGGSEEDLLSWDEAEALDGFGRPSLHEVKSLLLKIRRGEVACFGRPRAIQWVTQMPFSPVAPGGDWDLYIQHTAFGVDWNSARHDWDDDEIILGPDRQVEQIPPELFDLKSTLAGLNTLRACNWNEGVIIEYLSVPRAQLTRNDGDPQGSVEPSEVILPASNREATSMLRLIAAMAVKGYAYSPSKKRNDATREIETDMAHLGIPMDQKTIKKYLKQATDLLPSE